MNTIRDSIQFMKLMGFENKTGLDSGELRVEVVRHWQKFCLHGARNAGEKNGVSGTDTNTDSNTKNTDQKPIVNANDLLIFAKPFTIINVQAASARTVYHERTDTLASQNCKHASTLLAQFSRNKFAINVQP